MAEDSAPTLILISQHRLSFLHLDTSLHLYLDTDPHLYLDTPVQRPRLPVLAINSEFRRFRFISSPIKKGSFG